MLAALLTAGGGWYAWREWLPPQEGVWFEATNQRDVSFLFADAGAPRGTYQAATLTYPKGTKTIVYATLSSPGPENRIQPQGISVFTKDVASEESQKMTGRLPGSYRFQERWLIHPWTLMPPPLYSATTGTAPVAAPCRRARILFLLPPVGLNRFRQPIQSELV